jgi:hypothetical protein
MDFIEQLFGVSPDGGNGLLEAVYLVALLLLGVTLTLGVLRRRRRWRAPERRRRDRPNT